MNDDSEIDGLPVDHWQSCMSWDDDKDTFLVDYYFTKEDFKPRDSLTPSQIPVRAEVRGVSMKSGKSRDFHHVYEFLDFRVFNALPLETFSIPDFMDCNGGDSVWASKFPTLPQSMKYTVEKVEHSTNGNVKVTLETVHIDGRSQLLRVDREGSTSISDFNTGVEYLIDGNKCTVRPISPDNVLSAENDNGVIRMIKRPEIDYLSYEYKYSGFKKFRDIKTNAFAFRGQDTDFEAYVGLDYKTPLGVKVTDRNTGLFTQYNIFEFVEFSNHQIENPFDVQQCKSTNQILHLTITLQAKGNGYIEETVGTDTRSVGNALRIKAAEIAGCSPVQIVSKDIDIVENNIYWSMWILEQDAKNAHANVPVQQNVRVKSKKEINNDLRNAVKEGRFEYVTQSNLYFEREFVAIYVQRSYDQANAAVRVQGDMNYHFQRLKGKCVKKFKEGADMTTTNSVHECAQACVDSRNVPCSLYEYIASTKTCQISWSEAPTELIQSADCEVYQRSYMYHFRPVPGEVLMKKDDVMYRRAKDSEECAKKCMEETGFGCESFDFCEAEGRCQLYDTHFYSKDANPVSGADYLTCTHYTLMEDLYDYYPKKDFVSEYAVEVQTKNVIHCDYLCTSDEDGCMAFTFCWPDLTTNPDGLGTCRLLPSSQAGKVTFKSSNDPLCGLSVARGVSKKGGKLSSKAEKTSSESRSYSGGAMFGLAVAMTTVGAGLAGLVYFLLQHFDVWKGF